MEYYLEVPTAVIDNGTITTEPFATDDPNKGIILGYYMQNGKCVEVSSNYIKII